MELLLEPCKTSFTQVKLLFQEFLAILICFINFVICLTKKKKNVYQMKLFKTTQTFFEVSKIT